MWVSWAWLLSGSYRGGSVDETGEMLGLHVWEEDIFTETGGMYLFCHVSLRYLPFPHNLPSDA